MKEKKRPAGHGKPVPDKIQAANVVEFMTQNVLKLGAVLLKANVRQPVGIILVFPGMISLGVVRGLIGLHMGEGIKIFAFFGGAMLLGLGFFILGRKRRSR